MAMLRTFARTLFLLSLMPSVSSAEPNSSGTDPFWRNATIYFLMTDRFANGDTSNDQAVGRKPDADKLRGFEGGDIQGVINKINDGYFSDLGVDAIWTTPLIENVHGHVGENEWGKTYSYHGYWPLDWTAIDPNLGTEAKFAEMVSAAHAKGIRVLADVIINHAGAPTAIDPKWPSEWVRSGPACDYKSFAGTASCELSFTLQDIRTESDAEVTLPPFLLEKWRREGRLQREQAELEAFFTRTQLPRAPKYYIVKWLTDCVREYGIDGFRVDTAKHTDPEVWLVLKREAELALADWRVANPKRLQPDRPFYLVGEVYNYGVAGFENAATEGLAYEFGDRDVNFYEFGFDALINMGFATHAQKPAAELFALYNQELQGRFSGKGILNYISSHDDMKPLDPARKQAFSAANLLMLAPGAVQIYYGDELSRSLVVPGTKGDATLRSNMDWQAANSKKGAEILQHWQKLGRFRRANVAVGAGVHQQLQAKPLVFARVLGSEGVVVALALDKRSNDVPVAAIFAEGEVLIDAYSGERLIVKNGVVTVRGKRAVVLLAKAK